MGDSTFWTRIDHLHASSVDCEGVALKLTLIGHVNHLSQQLAKWWGTDRNLSETTPVTLPTSLAIG